MLDVLTDDQWAHTELHFSRHVYKRPSLLIDIIEVLNRAKLKWHLSTPLFCCMVVSFLTQHAESFLQMMWWFFPHPSWWYNKRMVYFSDFLIIWKYLLFFT